MYERLATCRLPVDNLLSEFYQTESLEPIIKSINPRFGKWPIEHYISLDLVMHPKIRDVVRKYITKLLEDKEQYGYIYYLSNQNLLIPLTVRFQGIEVFTEHEDRDRVFKAIDELASEFGCRGSLMHEITMVEIYYFFIRLINRKLSWLAVEYMINSIQQHVHLLMSPERKYSWIEKESELQVNKNKLLFCVD